MFTLLAAFIATFVALCKGLMLLIGVFLGGAAFLFLLGALLVAGVTGLIQAWHDRDTVGARA